MHYPLSVACFQKHMTTAVSGVVMTVRISIDRFSRISLPLEIHDHCGGVVVAVPALPAGGTGLQLLYAHAALHGRSLQGCFHQ